MQFPNGWLAFEIAVLQRLKFASVALPFTGEPEIAIHFKRTQAPVAANDPMICAYTKATALIENYGVQLAEEDCYTLLDDAYVPRDKLDNQGLLKWFNEGDAWWFDNVRFNAERLEPYKRALALTAGMMVGDYVLSFNDETRALRQPFALSNVFNLIIDGLPSTKDEARRNKTSNQDVRSFVAERYNTDLLFLRLPVSVTQTTTARDPLISWREEWLRGGDDFWVELEKERGAKLGSRVQSK